MKLTPKLLTKLSRLSNGEILPASSLKGEFFEQMLADGVLVPVVHGSRKSYRVREARAFMDSLEARFGTRDISALVEMANSSVSGEKPARSEQVQLTGDSKFFFRRSFYGFLVNSYEPITSWLGGEAFCICPKNGTFTFIYDWQIFRIPEDVVIVGVENAANFRYIREQKWLFDLCFPEGTRLLFISRYPQNQSRDVIIWLKEIPNRYIHFGDLDLAGIHIFLTEFYPDLGSRSSYLVPPDYDRRLAQGSPDRYEDQYSRFGQMSIPADIGPCAVPGPASLTDLLSAIHRHHRGYDQEGYIQF